MLLKISLRHFSSIRYEVRDHLAFITLSRPKRMNAIDELMPSEIENAVKEANNTRSVKVGEFSL